MALEFSFDRRPTAAAVALLYDRAGLRRPTDDLGRMQRMIDHADVNLAAWDGDRLAGFARALTDYSFCCYLSDLAVDPDDQGQGLGQELIRRLREHLGPEVQLILLAAPSAVTYYPHIGFEAHPSAWTLRRER